MRQRRRFTLAYAVAFLFDTPGTRFEMGRKVYQYVATVYDHREDGRGTNAIAVVYDFNKQEYRTLNTDEPGIGAREIIFFP